MLTRESTLKRKIHSSRRKRNGPLRSTIISLRRRRRQTDALLSRFAGVEHARSRSDRESGYEQYRRAQRWHLCGCWECSNYTLQVVLKCWRRRRQHAARGSIGI